MNRSEQVLVVFLRLAGVLLLTAVIPAVMPFAWMKDIHRLLGMGELPGDPRSLDYLTRSLSLMYANARGVGLLPFPGHSPFSSGGEVSRRPGHSCSVWGCSFLMSWSGCHVSGTAERRPVHEWSWVASCFGLRGRSERLLAPAQRNEDVRRHRNLDPKRSRPQRQVRSARVWANARGNLCRHPGWQVAIPGTATCTATPGFACTAQSRGPGQAEKRPGPP